MTLRGRLSLLGSVAIIVAACSSGGAGASSAPSAAPSTAPSAAESTAPSTAPSEAASEAVASPIAGGLLAKVLEAGKFVVSTDANYAPQSFLKKDGTFEGFDIDVATEIAKRLGVDVEWEAPAWDVITAGSWNGRWDMSVGSMTTTNDRQEVLDFTQPYNYTPAQMAASTASGITTLDGLPARPSASAPRRPMTIGSRATARLLHRRPTWPPARRRQGPVAEDRRGLPAAGELPVARFRRLPHREHRPSTRRSRPAPRSIKIGDPVYQEPLAVAVDKSGPDPRLTSSPRLPEDHPGHARGRDPEGPCPRSGSRSTSPTPADAVGCV